MRVIRVPFRVFEVCMTFFQSIPKVARPGSRDRGRALETQRALRTTVALLVLASVWTVSGRQTTPPVFGPVDLLRKSGAPQQFKWTFNTAPGPARVCLFNGGSSGQYERVSSASVKLNGVDVFTQSAFNQNVPTLSQSVSVLSENDLTAELASKPDSGFTLWVQPGTSCAGSTTNSAPVITSEAVTTGQWLEPYTYSVGAMDADHDPLLFSLPAAPPGMTIDPNTGVVSWIPAGFGAFDVAVRVSDDKGGEAIQTFTLTIPTPANRAPTLVPIANRQVPLGATFKLGLVADDPDFGDSLTFDLVSGPAGAAVSPTPMLMWTPQAGQVGQHVLTVRVTDLAGASDSGSFTIDVTNTNGAPVLDPQPDGTTAPGTLIARTLTAIDPNPGDTLTFGLVSGPAGLSVSSSGALAWTPALSDLGPHQVKVSVTDAAGLSDATTFTISVDLPQSAQPPTAVDDLYAVRKLSTLTVTAPGVLANDLNPSGLPLGAALVTPPSKGSLSLNSDGGFSYTPTIPAPDSTAPALKFEFLSTKVNNTPGSNYSQPAVADLNKDGVPEIVILSVGQAAVRRLTAVRGDTGTALWTVDAYQPLANPQIVLSLGHGGSLASLTIGDLDNDGYLEVLAVHSDDETSKIRRRIIAFNHDGSYRWTSDDIVDTVNVTQTTGMVQIDLADLDADGIPEIISHHAGKSPLTPSNVVSEDLVTVFNSDGSLRWTKRVPGTAAQEALAIADIDLDGRPDLVVGDAALDHLGNIKWNVKGTNSGVVDVAIANFDNDPFVEIIALDRFGGIHSYEHDGVKRWGPVTRPGGFSFGQLGIADTDGDGLPEILLPRAVTLTGAIEVRDGNGNLLRTMHLPGDLNNQGHGGSITTFDLNGDGRPEVLYHALRGSFDLLTSHGSVFIFDGPSGALLHEVHASRSTNTDSGPTVVDVDGDGSAEIVTGGWSDGILLSVFEAATGDWAQTRSIWNQKTYHVTNVESNGRIPAHETVNWLTPGLNNYRVNVPMPAERLGDIDQFTYTASSAGMTSNVATVRLDILPPNTAPRILSIAATAASPDIEYLYAVRAVDPDAGETLTFSLQMGPAGMVLGSSTGLIKWTPLTGTTGSMMVIVQVTDSQGQTDSQQFTIVLGPPVNVPDVVGQTTADAGNALTAAGLETGSVSTAPSSTVTAGLVMSQSPTAGSLVAAASRIDLIVSSGPAPVYVPLVVGQSESEATGLLDSFGFGVSVTRTFSNTVPAGEVIAQNPAAGTVLVPGSVAITVSAGSGLRLRLLQGAMTAGASIPFTVTAYDLDFVDIATPPLAYDIAPALSPSYGALPAVSGGVVMSDATTRGVFHLTATDPATGRTATDTFAVTYPREPAGQPSMAEKFEGMLQAMADIEDVARRARLEFAVNNSAVYRGLLDEMVQRWKQVDVIELRLATPFGLPEGFFPAPSDLPALGLTLTPDDQAAEQVLRDMLTDLKAWTDGLLAPSTTMPQLELLADQFRTRAARLQSLTMSHAGVIKSAPVITMLLSDRLPAFYGALMSELALVVANASADPDAIASGPSAGSESLLAEVLTSQAIEYAIQKVFEQVSPFHEYAGDMYEQAAWSAAVVAASAQFRSDMGAGSLTAVIAGAWMSVHSFEMPWSIIEGGVDTDDPLNNVIITLGPDVLDRIESNAQGEADSLFGMLDTVINAGELYGALSMIYGWLENGADSAEGVAKILEDSFQGPSEGLKGCLFSSATDCGQLVFNDGFVSVYNYDPPDGFESLTGLPVPILFIVYNKTSGAFFIDTPVFLPTKGGGN